MEPLVTKQSASPPNVSPNRLLREGSDLISVRAGLHYLQDCKPPDSSDVSSLGIRAEASGQLRVTSGFQTDGPASAASAAPRISASDRLRAVDYSGVRHSTTQWHSIDTKRCVNYLSRAVGVRVGVLQLLNCADSMAQF